MEGMRTLDDVFSLVFVLSESFNPKCVVSAELVLEVKCFMSRKVQSKYAGARADPCLSAAATAFCKLPF